MRSTALSRVTPLKMAQRLGARVMSVGRTLATASKAHGHKGAGRLWKSVSLVIALPGVAVCMLNVYLKKPQEPAEFVPYTHLRIRSKV